MVDGDFIIFVIVNFNKLDPNYQLVSIKEIIYKMEKD